MYQDMYLDGGQVGGLGWGGLTGEPTQVLDDSAGRLALRSWLPSGKGCDRRESYRTALIRISTQLPSMNLSPSQESMTSLVHHARGGQGPLGQFTELYTAWLLGALDAADLIEYCRLGESGPAPAGLLAAAANTLGLTASAEARP